MLCVRSLTRSLATCVSQLTRMLTESCYRALLNMLTSRSAETSRHQRLYDKQQRVETILATLRQQGAEDDQLAEVSPLRRPTADVTVRGAGPLLTSLSAVPVHC